MKLKKVLALVLVAVIAASCTACTTIELVIPVVGVPSGNITPQPEQTPAVTDAVATQAPATQAPATQAPATQAPATQAPATQAPATQAPVLSTPTDAPATQAPATQAPATQAPVTEAPATQAPATEAPATQAPATEAPATQAPATEAPATQAPATEAPAPSGAPQGTAAIVEYYNTAVNKVKTSAKSVTRNFEDNKHNEDKLVVPSALQSTGSKLISTFLKPNNTPETYDGTDAIKEKFPLPGESYTSKLTEADVLSAECKDNGSEYEITIVAKTEKNPTYGQGVSAGFEIIKTEDVMDAAGFIVKSFETEYYDCTVKCKVDKATGNITWINFSAPVVMNVSTKIGIDAQVGMTFVKDYTVTF